MSNGLQPLRVDNNVSGIKNIEFLEEHAKVNYDRSDGTVSSKIVSLYDLCAAFADSVQSYETIVPKGCRYIVENGNSMFILFITPEHIGQAACRWNSRESELHGNFADLPRANPVNSEYALDTRVFTIPYPATAMIADMTKSTSGRVTTYHLNNLYCYALKNDSLPLDQMEVSRWPFTNVWESGRCCIGSDAVTTYPTMESMSGIPSIIYRGINNHDLDRFSGDSNNNMGYVINTIGKLRFGKIERGFDFVVALHGAESFPYEYLIDLHITVKEAVDSLVRTIHNR